MEHDWHARGGLAEKERLKDWLESQNCILGFWINRVAEKGDIAMLDRLLDHRRQIGDLRGALD